MTKPKTQKKPKKTKKMEDDEAHASPGQSSQSPTTGSSRNQEDADPTNPGIASVLQTLEAMRKDMATQFSSVLSAIQDTRGQIAECVGRLTQTEERISMVEDSMTEIQATNASLKKMVQELSIRFEDLDNRSRQSCLRLVGLPERSEGIDPCAFLESWLPEAVGMGPLRKPFAIEETRRIGKPNETQGGRATTPRIMIMKFVDYRDKLRVLEAARKKREIFFENQRVMLFPDFSAETNKHRRSFNEVKKKLRAEGLEYRLLYPANLQVTHNNTKHVFRNPIEVEEFLTRDGKR